MIKPMDKDELTYLVKHRFRIAPLLHGHVYAMGWAIGRRANLLVPSSRWYTLRYVHGFKVIATHGTRSQVEASIALAVDNGACERIESTLTPRRAKRIR